MKLVRALQVIGRWYFTTWGILFNIFAIMTLFSFSPMKESWGVVDPMQNLAVCSKALSGLKISFRDQLRFTTVDHFNQEQNLVLLGERSSLIGRTLEGGLVVSTQIKPVDDDQTQAQPITLEVSSSEHIIRCLPSPLSAQARLTECLASAGKPEAHGDCLLEIALPSDCEVMGGKLEQERICRVPRSGRILSRKFAALESN